MKKQRLFKLTALLVLCCLMVGCKKEDNSSNEGGKGSIYGTVTDFATGDPVVNANVQLLMSGNATLHASITGSDGHYEIPDVPSGTYSIKVTKVGYSDLIDNNPIVVEKDKQTKRDAQIKKLPSSLHIYDDDSNEISELDFGADEGVMQKTFNIFNGGERNLQYSITIPTNANWVSINPDQLTGTVGVNVTWPIIVTINRELLADGNNTTNLMITSATDGGKELTIKAKKNSAEEGVFELPSAGLMVQTEDLGCVDWSSAKLLCETSTVAGYSDWRLPSKEELMTLYSNRELIGGFVSGIYWSSSRDDYNLPYCLNFRNGNVIVANGYFIYYNVRAVRTLNGGGGGGSAPSAPTGIFAEVSGSRIKLSWNSVSDANEYTVYKSNNDSNYNVLGTTSYLFFYDDIPSNNNYYKVKAKNNYGESPFSPYAYCTYSSGGGSIPSAPEGVLANVSGSRIKVSWRTVSNAMAYFVYWSNDGITYTNIGETDEECFYDDATYEDNYYKIKTVSYGGGVSPFSAPAYCHYSSGGGSSSQTYSYDFEDGSQGWQVIDADGDGYTWKWANSSGGYNGHNGSIATMVSESYSNDLMVALSPDNYLVSPQRYSISNGAKIKFYVCAQDVNYPAEHYGVAVSTQATPDSDDFVIIDEWTLSAKVKSGGKIRGNRTQGTWYLKTVDLSAYAGQSIWIAIRHFNCYDEFMIDVDDITIVTGN